jgi:hypothetical protein
MLNPIRLIKILICLVWLTLQHKKKSEKKENDKEIFFNDTKMKSYNTRDDLEI